MTEETTSHSPIAESERKWAAVSYLWILWIIPLLIKRDSTFVQFHAKQGMILFVAEIIAGLIPVLGWMVGIILIITAVVGVLQSLQGRFWEIPFLGKYAKNLSF